MTLHIILPSDFKVQKDDIIKARDIAKEAYYAALQGRSYTINLGGTSRQVTRNDVDILYGEWQRWENALAQLERPRSRLNYVTPIH